MASPHHPLTHNRSPRGEALFLALYSCALIAYLFLHPEPELWHWLTLVMLPLGAVAAMGRYPSLTSLLRSLGLNSGPGSAGWPLALAFIIAFQGLQLLNRAQRSDLVQLLGTRWGPLLPVLAFILLLGTAATTEEIFFRGLLQARFADALRSPLAAMLLATLLFALYHVPYAYARPGSPTLGDLPGAFRAGFTNGLLGGVPLAFVYWRSRYQLLPAICLHAAIDIIPATRWLGTALGVI